MERVERGRLGNVCAKRKLKLIKMSLKEWHKKHTQNLGEKIKVAKGEFYRLEIKEESTRLSEEEL